MRIFKVGFMFFGEAFGKDLLYRIRQLEPLTDHSQKPVRIEAEHVGVHEWDLNCSFDHDLILDRASHYFKLGIPQFMIRAFQGACIVNNPLSFHWFMERKDVGFQLAHALGIDVPPTYTLPVCETPFFKKDDFVHHRLFRWEDILLNVGFPCILKPSNGRGARDVFVLRNKRELMEAYKASGTEIMTLQRKVESPYPWQLRCLCIGREIQIIKYIFREGDRSEYLEEKDFLRPETYHRVLNSARILNRLFGYEMNSVEFFLDHEDRPWAIDFNNPIPDGRQEALGEQWYEEYMQMMVRMIIEKALNPQPSPFLPDLQPFSDIARSHVSRDQKFKKALEIANSYYED